MLLRKLWSVMAAQVRVSSAAMREAHGMVVALIDWELYAADGERMSDACEKYGTDVITEAMWRIRDQLVRAGAALGVQGDETRHDH